MENRKRAVRSLLLAVGAALLLLAGAAGYFVYRTQYAPTPVLRSASADGAYTLTVSMLGEPDFPFGAAHCRAELFRGVLRVVWVPFAIWDDGAAAREENFSVEWEEDRVRLRIMGSEQEDLELALGFDGTVEPL